jgi:hypothetical protein
MPRTRFANYVRESFETGGWSVQPSDRQNELRGHRDGQTLFVVVCANPAGRAVKQAYARVLHADVGADVRVLALNKEAADTALNLPIAPRDRLSVAIRVLTKEGAIHDLDLELIVSDQIPSGPAGWCNWQAFNYGIAARQRIENGLYSDSTFIGQLDALGPFDLINTRSLRRRAPRTKAQ